jgi:hypothetical protein
MKRILFLIICTSFTKVYAQHKLTWQIVFEPGIMKATSAKTSTVYSSYIFADSAANLFKKYNQESLIEKTSKVKAGVSGGVYLTYPVNTNIKINAAVLFSKSSVERNINYYYKTNDSSLITLQGTSPSWHDQENGNTVLWYTAMGLDGKTHTGLRILNSPNDFFPHTDGVEKINFTGINIPIGITFVPDRSDFSFSADIDPAFLISSFANIQYNANPEIIYTNMPDYKVTNMLWQFTTGIHYKINEFFEIGLTYKRSINSVVEYDNIKINSVGLQIRFTIPGKKQL